MHWIYYNAEEDKKQKNKDIQDVIEELNWRLKPETASELDKIKKRKERKAAEQPDAEEMQQKVVDFLDQQFA